MNNLVYNEKIQRYGAVIAKRKLEIDGKLVTHYQINFDNKIDVTTALNRSAWYDSEFNKVELMLVDGMRFVAEIGGLNKVTKFTDNNLDALIFTDVKRLKLLANKFGFNIRVRIAGGSHYETKA